MAILALWRKDYESAEQAARRSLELAPSYSAGLMALGQVLDFSGWHEQAIENWDIEKGCPSFVCEPPGDAITKNPARLDDVKIYVRNLARWLAPEALK